MSDRDYGYLYGQRVKDDTVEYHYKNINPDKVTLDKPLVLVFGGSGTIGSKSVNGYLKAIESLLGEFSFDVDIIGLDYNVDYDLDFYYDNAEALVDFILYPHLQKDGKKTDVKSVCKKMRQVTIFTHCFGNRLANVVIKQLEYILTKLGYNKEECNKIIEQIFVVSYAPIELNDTHANSLSVVSPKDDHIKDNDYAWKVLLSHNVYKQTAMNTYDRKEIEKFKEKLNDIEKDEIIKHYDKNDRVYIVKDNLNDNSLYLAASCPFDKEGMEHSIKFMPRDKDYKALERATKVGDYVSKCIISALCNSVANSILNNQSEELIPFDLDELKLELENVVKPINFQETTPYEKISE